MSSFINVSELLSLTQVEGPSLRACIWVQGCIHACEGCCNKETWAMTKKSLRATEEVCRWLEHAKEAGAEGLTLLGGEPFLQAPELAVLAQKAQGLGMGVITFTGFTHDNLLIHEKNGDLQGVSDLLKYSDVLIDGKYDSTKPDRERNWVGSTNQRFIYFTERYTPLMETDPRYKNTVEIRETFEGLVINGTPHFQLEEVVCD